MSLLLVVCTGAIVAGGMYRCVIVGGVDRCVLLVVVLHVYMCVSLLLVLCRCVSLFLVLCAGVSFTGVHRCVSFLVCTGV